MLLDITVAEMDADGAIRRLPWSIDGLRTFAVVLAEATTSKSVPRSSFHARVFVSSVANSLLSA